jgi:hypothetical protein
MAVLSHQRLGVPGGLPGKGRKRRQRHAGPIGQRSFLRWQTIAVSFVLAVCLVGRARAQSSPDEYRVKAAFLFNFGQFVEWPPDHAVGEAHPLTLCSAGDDRMRDALQSSVAGKQVNGNLVRVKFMSKGESALDCHILFFAADDSKAVTTVLGDLKTAPVLTIGETPDFARQGGMIRFCLEGNKVRFEINPNAAERARLRISSKLLLLAKAIIGERKQGGL